MEFGKGKDTGRKTLEQHVLNFQKKWITAQWELLRRFEFGEKVTPASFNIVRQISYLTQYEATQIQDFMRDAKENGADPKKYKKEALDKISKIFSKRNKK